MTSKPTQFLPDLCRLPVVMGVLAVTQLLVIIYVLSLNAFGRFDWSLLSLLSLYAQWISILSIAGLCRFRSTVNKLSPNKAGCLSFFWVLLVTAVTNSFSQVVFSGNDWSRWQVDWLLRDLAIYAVIAGMALRYLYILQQWRQEQEATHAATLDALYARIRPHFLFNTMNTIASLIAVDPDRAEESVEDLSLLLRETLSDRSKLVAWDNELAICKAYSRIEQLRLDNRLQVNWQLEDMPRDFRLPPLVLQPLLENAIYHGVEKREQGGVIDIHSELVDVEGPGEDLLRITVTNPLPDGGNQADAQIHYGLALENIKARLSSIYRDRESGQQLASLLTEMLPDSYKVQLNIPLYFDPVENGIY